MKSSRQNYFFKVGMKDTAKSTFFERGLPDNFYLVAGTDLALLQDLGKDPLAGHDAVPDSQENMAAVVALLPDLGYAQERLADPEPGADRQRRKIDPLCRDVFGEIAEPDIQPFFPDLVYTLLGEKAYLPARSRMGVALQAAVQKEIALARGCLLLADFFADIYGQYPAFIHGLKTSL
jgi:hypothetical protein